MSILPVVSEASFARRLGSSYGGTLSTNTSLSTQQLTADPASVLQGSVSTEYDPSIVSLQQLIPSEFFHVSALIGVRLAGDPPTTERFVTDSAFFGGGLPANVSQTGYIQVSFQRTTFTDEPATVPTLPGYVVVDTGGETDGDETHALVFKSVSLDPNAIASYHIYQEDGTHHAVVPDFLTDLNHETNADTIGDATVSGVVPEPVSLGALGLLGAGLLVRRRSAAR